MRNNWNSPALLERVHTGTATLESGVAASCIGKYTRAVGHSNLLHIYTS